jgi:acyl-[acyl-carrier-protein] desaturase
MHTSTVTLHQVRQELEADRPRHARALLSPAARARAIERGLLGLYRWYSEQSQRRRNWHADTCIDWRRVRRDHGDAVATIVEGFFAVEQYTPDYVGPLLGLIRESYGRSQWHVYWGAEETRHADLWRNAVGALGRRDQQWIEDYTSELRRRQWALPWESPRHILFYQVIQERATQVSYLNLGLALSGKLSRLVTPVDTALAQACQLIAVDEAAHYGFFAEVARLFLYYEPESSLDALVDVLRHFTMPARDLIPNYDHFGRVLHDSGVFGRSIHYRDVVAVILRTLSAPALRELETGVRRAREIPATEGPRRTAAFLDTLEQPEIERKVAQLFARNRSHLERTGLGDLCDTNWTPAWAFDDEELV